MALSLLDPMTAQMVLMCPEGSLREELEREAYRIYNVAVDTEKVAETLNAKRPPIEGDSNGIGANPN